MTGNQGALSRVPENLNLLSQINFKMMLVRSPEVEYFLTKVNVPGVLLPATKQPTPFVDIWQYGDHVQYKPLVVTFKVDENLTNYLTMYQWIRDLGKSDTFDQFKNLKANPQISGYGLKSDIVVSILDSARNANFNITYYDCIPVELSDLQFDAQATDVMMINAAVSIRFLTWDFTTNA